MLFESCLPCCSRGEKAGFFGTPQPLLLLDETDSESVHTEESCLLREGPRSNLLEGKDGYRKVFFDAVSSDRSEGNRQEEEPGGDEVSLFYFDAACEPLRDDEYPFSMGSISPSSLCRGDVSKEAQRSTKNVRTRRKESAEVEQRRIFESLQEPRVRIPGAAGYPGNLNRHELEECKSLMRRLQDLDPALKDQLYSFRDVEDEAYTICRWLRASNFSAKRAIQRLQENQAFFQEAKKHNFFPDVSNTIGAPLSVFYSQFPFLTIGRASNGCCVNYLLVKPIQPEGIFSMTTSEGLKGYFWWNLMWKLKAEMRQASKTIGQSDSIVLAEGINVIDLKGLSASLLSTKTFEIIKVASKIDKCFPETLHFMLLLNAPGVFCMTWRMIKGLLDPNTAKRIKVFSNTEQGLIELQRLVCNTQIPKNYGGTNKSFRQAFLDASGDPTLLRQEVELLQSPRSSRPERSKEGWRRRLQRGEAMTVRVYTRSRHACKIAFGVDGKIWETFLARGAVDAATSEILPQCTPGSTEIIGPAEISIEIVPMDCDEGDRGRARKGKGGSNGYFLIVGDVRRT